MNVNIELHNANGRHSSRAKRGERGVPPYTDISTNMNVNIELHKAPPVHTHKYEQEIQNPLC